MDINKKCYDFRYLGINFFQYIKDKSVKVI